MKAGLALQQQSLVQALWAPNLAQAVTVLAPHVDPAGPQPQWERGLQAYRSHGLALAQRALAGAYPVLRMLLGEEDFDALARRHWRLHPPACGDVAQWGSDLAGDIETMAPLVGPEPYLPDVARLEWLVHLAATAADAQPAPHSFALLASSAPESLALVAAPGLACLASTHPVGSIVSAHLDGEPSLQEAGLRLRQGLGETVVVWRQGLRPARRLALAGEAALLAQLQQRRSLADALAAAPGLDFQAWLPLAVHTGLLTGVHPC